LCPSKVVSGIFEEKNIETAASCNVSYEKEKIRCEIKAQYICEAVK
jgi:hypothetical protein